MRIELVLASLAISSTALAQVATPASVPSSGSPTATVPVTPPPATTAQAGETEVTETAAPEDKSSKEPKRGDFNAGGQVRLPNGPGDDGTYSTWNWVAFDAKGKYYLLKYVTIDGTIPLAVKKPDMALGEETSIIGGITTRLEAKTPPIRMPFMKEKSEVGISLGAGYMREGAMLLSERDFPLFVGDFQPGATVGLISRVKLGKIVDFNFNPQWVWQKGSDENATALQIPLSLVVSAGDVLKLGTELGVYTGDDYAFGASDGGRIATGVSVDVKLGKILAHAGVGFASLLTDEMGMYPTVTESMYVDLNVKYAG